MANERFLTAYIDLPFLRELFRQKPEDITGGPADDWPVVWLNAYHFLRRSAKIVVDASKEEIENSHEVIQSFLFGSGMTRHVCPDSDVSERFSDPDEVEVGNAPFSVFLFENPDIPVDELRRRKGLLFLRHKDLDTYWLHRFDEHVLNVLPSGDLPQGEGIFDWSDLRSHAAPLNAVVIADKFAFGQFRDDNFEQNLGELLLALLPESLDFPVHVSLVTDLWQSVDKDLDPGEDSHPRPNEIYDRMKTHIEEHRPKLDVELTVIDYREASDDVSHKDRFVFTNYGVFTSNDSFSFFDEEGLTKETLVTYLPSSTRASVVRPRLRRIAGYCKDAGYYRPYQEEEPDKILLAQGKNRNRLLDELEWV